MNTAVVRPLLAAAAVLAIEIVGALLPYSDVMPPPQGLNELGAFALGEQALWVAVAAVAAARPATIRFALLVIVASMSNLVWALGYTGSDALFVIAERYKAIDTVVFAHLIVAFPTGRLRDRFDRLVVEALYAYVAIGGTIQLIAWDPHYTCDPGSFCPRNPFLIAPNDDLVTLLGTAQSALVPLIGIAVIAAVVRHWRTATGVGRRILRPVVIALPVEYVILSFGYLALAVNRPDLADVTRAPLLSWNTLLLPGAFLVGVLQARLARSAVADLAVEVAHGVPLGALRHALARTLRDPTLALAFPAPTGDGYVDPDGRAVELPVNGARRAVTRIERDGEVLAVLVHDPEIDAEDPGLVERVAAVARLALENERLSAQVRAQLEEVRESRLRIIEAADAERRRVERDLHDGAQQRLVALAMRLELARDSTAGASTLIDETTAELRTAIAEVRGLARGLHPTILTESGLAAALEALAERSAVPVHVVAPERRFAPPIEAAAYYVAAEALTNVAKYAGATAASVTVEQIDEGLRITVADDGRGGADPEDGTGIRGLADRVAAIGGRLTVTSATGQGTTIVADLRTAPSRNDAVSVGS